MAGLVDFGLGDIFTSLIGLGGELIEDKDKRNEYNMKIMESRNKLDMAILQMKTHPKVDAFVKVLFALNSLWRPALGASMTIFGIYAHLKEGIDLSVASQAIFDGAFPAWGLSRHVEKNKKN